MTLTDTAVGADLAALIARKAGTQIAVCIPARDEAATIGDVVAVGAELRLAGLVDDLVVIDDGSTDATAAVAQHMGATVVASIHGPGKGQALAAAVAATHADLLVFLDADVTNTSARFVTDLVAPLLAQPAVQVVKANYRRSCRGQLDEGGRVTELLARPLLRHLFPKLDDVSQPLAGECALRRSALGGIDLAPGYGVEIGLLIDVSRQFGPAAIVEVDLGERVHRNRPLHELRQHADDIVAAVFERVDLPSAREGARP